MWAPKINFVEKDFLQGQDFFYTKIRFETIKTPLTLIFTETGVVGAGFYQNPDEFPKVMRDGKEKDLPKAIQDMPFYAIGTPFQHEVWKALLTISKGQTISYQGLAEKAGYPKAIRAAASAVAQNKLCPYIPCHRVIRTDGALGGFAYGLDLKRELLESEDSTCITLNHR